MLPVDLHVGLNDPMLTIKSSALEYEGVRPGAPFFGLVQMALGPANRLVDPCEATGKSDAPWRGVTSQKFFIGEPCDQNGLICGGCRLH
jgi:hypothetical protein